MPPWDPPQPAVTALLGAAGTPAASVDARWGVDGELPLRINAHVGPIEISEEHVSSIRCLVEVDGRVVVCSNVHGKRHPWPGGRLEPGERFVEAACREVHEETGWLLDPQSLHPLGWLHIDKQLDERPVDHPFPQKDFVMVVWSGRASERDGGRDSEWTDTEGYELSSELMTVADAIVAVEDDDPTSVPFLRLLT